MSGRIQDEKEQAKLERRKSGESLEGTEKIEENQGGWFKVNSRCCPHSGPQDLACTGEPNINTVVKSASLGRTSNTSKPGSISDLCRGRCRNPHMPSLQFGMNNDVRGALHGLSHSKQTFIK